MRVDPRPDFAYVFKALWGYAPRIFLSDSMSNRLPKHGSSVGATSSRSRDLCIWLVSPIEGRVRKIKLKPWSLVLFSAFAFIGLAVVSYIAGDYARLQILKGKNYLFMQSLSMERDTLKDSNEGLRSKLSELESQQDRIANYERDLRERLERLRAVVASIESLGKLPDGKDEIMARPKAEALKPSVGGIGGAEVECRTGDLKCAGVLLEESFNLSSPGMLNLGLFSPFQSLFTKAKSLLGWSGAGGELGSDELLAEFDAHMQSLNALPLGLPGVAEVSSGYGYRKSPFTRRRVLHEGMDFSLPYGSPVLSSGQGIVKAVRFHRTYGLMIDVEHTPRVVSRYAHLKKTLVRIGDKVERGGRIALVGSTGRSTGAHLHYEVLVDGEPRDPAGFIALGERVTQLF